MPGDRVKVVTGSRLHFGLLSLPPQEATEGITPRWFGGVGLMVQSPGVTVEVEPSDEWDARGPLASRALAFAQRTVAALSSARNYRIDIRPGAREHVGLGTGTQLGLAICKAIAVLEGRDELTTAGLAAFIDRGNRSALGIHGFEQGGFVVDGGKGPRTVTAPLIARLPFPSDWSVVLASPRGQGLHGLSESEGFARLQSSPSQRNALCQLALLGMMPALVEGDLDVFGESLYEFNRRVGEMFAPLQGGVYASPETAEIVSFIRQTGVKGVGQSSWGPTVFAIVESHFANELCSRLSSRYGFGLELLIKTAAMNDGAQISHSKP